MESRVLRHKHTHNGVLLLLFFSHPDQKRKNEERGVRIPGKNQKNFLCVRAMDFSMAIVSPTGTAPFLLFFFFFFISTTLCARPACLVGDSGRGTDGEKITDAVKQ
jgi:hypothetical protein